ncbi:RIP metalloprotease RseP [Candidatus Aerophobetes bacterium]|nr:RIP metalloprotease RseP [Candidatus Aerophobetes bacterium]
MIVTVVSIILVFFLLIFPHELGHFLLAKIWNIRVDKFSLGMGPKLFSFKRGETEYLISWLPIGGYVKIAGMQPGEENVERGFQKQSLGRRILVLLAGSFANYLVAIILFTLIFMVGFWTFQVDIPIIGEVKDGSPAALANLTPGDKILKINGKKIGKWEDIAMTIEENKEEETLTLEIQREKEIFTVTLTPAFDPDLNKKVIGITPLKVFKRCNPLVALIEGAKESFMITGLIFISIGGMITGKVPLEFAGPVGIVQFVRESAHLGVISLLSLAAFLSINLALFNLFPIPVLDGGRLFLLLLEKIRGKALGLEKEAIINYIGFIIIIFLFFLVTYQDILRIMGG